MVEGDSTLASVREDGSGSGTAEDGQRRLKTMLRWPDDKNEQQGSTGWSRQTHSTRLRVSGKTREAWRWWGFNREFRWPLELYAVAETRRRAADDEELLMANTVASSDGVKDARNDSTMARVAQRSSTVTQMLLGGGKPMIFGALGAV